MINAFFRAKILVPLFYLILTAGFFYPYFTGGKIPFPANLLVSTYSPWKNMTGRYAGAANKANGFDTVRQAYINRVYMVNELKSGRIPLWNPYIFAGTPFLAVFDPAVFYPLNLLFLLLPTIDAWSLLVILQPVMSGIFMFMFLRSLDIGKIPALFGSIVYSFSGWMIVYWEEALIVEHSIIWLPLSLWGINRIYSRRYRSGFPALVLGLTASVLAGFLQSSIYVWSVTAFWAIYKFRPGLKKPDSLSAVAGGFLASIFVSAIALLPALELYFHSPRQEVSGVFLFQDFLAPLSHLITFFVPDFWGNPGVYNYFGRTGFYYEKMIYIGIPAVMLAIYAFLSQKSRSIRFWKFFSVITLSLGFALPTSWIFYWAKIPILSSSLPTRIFTLSTFGFSVLAAYGMSFISARINLRIWIKISVVLILLFAGLWGFILFMWLVTNKYDSLLAYCNPAKTELIETVCRLFAIRDIKNINFPYEMYARVSLRNLILPSLFIGLTIFSVFLRRINSRLFQLAIITLSLISSFYFAKKYLYFSERRFVYPPVAVVDRLRNLSGVNRVWQYGNSYFEKNIPMYFGLYSPDGYNGMYPLAYGKVTSVISTNGKPDKSMVTRSDADIKSASEKEPMGDNKARLRFMSLAGVKYVLETFSGEDKDHLTTARRFPENLFKPVWSDKTWRIWEYRQALPRTFMVHKYKVANGDAAIEKFYSSDFHPEREVILPENLKNPLPECKYPEKSRTDIGSMTADRVVINTSSSCDGLVFLSDTFFPGWRAKVDNRQAEILNANYTFRAVPVPAGNHKIIMEYRPFSFYLGLALSLAGILIFIFQFFYLSKP